MKQLILEKARACGVANPQTFVTQCEAFYGILAETNKVMNLTRIIDFDDFAIKHVIDSLSIADYFPYVAKKPLQVADIGCGAGFPSLILAMAFPNLQLTPIDSTGKKAAFVKRSAEELKLTNVHVVNGRANELNRKKEFIGKFDLVTARAVAPAPIIYLDSAAFVNAHGNYIFYKTPTQLEEELPAMRRLCTKNGLKWAVSETFELPNNAGERAFLYSKH